MVRLSDAGHGYTEESMRYFERHRSELGEIREVSCRFNDPSGYNVRVVGDRGEMLLSGLNCGYGGEGPHGLHKLLGAVGAENRKFYETPISGHETIRYVRRDGREWTVETKLGPSFAGSPREAGLTRFHEVREQTEREAAHQRKGEIVNRWPVGLFRSNGDGSITGPITLGVAKQITVSEEMGIDELKKRYFGDLG